MKISDELIRVNDLVDRYYSLVEERKGITIQSIRLRGVSKKEKGIYGRGVLLTKQLIIADIDRDIAHIEEQLSRYVCKERREVGVQMWGGIKRMLEYINKYIPEGERAQVRDYFVEEGKHIMDLLKL